MSTLSLTLSNLHTITYHLSEEWILYYKIQNPILVTAYNGVKLQDRGPSVRQIRNLIYFETRPLAQCCGLDIWEGLTLDRTVSIEDLFNPWMEWVRSGLQKPAIIVLVRSIGPNGPTTYTVPAYQAFANHGELIAQYRNAQNHADHLLEVMAILPSGPMRHEILKVTNP